MKILLLEPFYGGSHRDFADGIKAYSRHRVDLTSLPARFWKWRMRGASIYFARKIQDPGRYDALLVSSMLGLADLQALWGPRCPPALVYFHENQLDYPLSPGETIDYQFGFTQITTALCARRVLFNSQTHLDGFLRALPDFIKMMPDRRPHWVIQQIAAKSAVAYPGCHFTPDARCFEQDKQDPPLIIWNHRWEHDKNPVVFFKALRSLQRRGIAFRLALLGEHYRNHPPEFEAAAVQFREHLVHFGYVPSRNEYYQWLRQGSVVVSTALQENFGIAVVEAMRHGCLPIVPKQLSFPEIVPRWLHADCLYRDQDDLEEKLAAQVLSSRDRQDTRKRLCSAMRPYAWPVAIGRFDQELGRLADRSSR